LQEKTQLIDELAALVSCEEWSLLHGQAILLWVWRLAGAGLASRWPVSGLKLLETRHQIIPKKRLWRLGVLS